MHVVDGIEDRGWIAAACDDYLHEGTIPLVVGTHESRDGLTRDLVELLRPDVLLVVCPGTTPPPVVPALRTPRPGRTHRWLEGDARALDAIAPILRSRFETAVHAAQRGVVSALLDGRRARAIADALDGDVAGFVLHR